METRKLFIGDETVILRQCEANEYTDIILLEGVKHIERFAFHRCHFLERVSLPSTLEVIENFAFRDCPKLFHVRLPDNLSCIEEHAFTESTLHSAFYVTITRNSPLHLLVETGCESVSGLFKLKERGRIIYI